MIGLPVLVPGTRVTGSQMEYRVYVPGARQETKKEICSNKIAYRGTYSLVDYRYSLCVPVNFFASGLLVSRHFAARTAVVHTAQFVK